ncbi:peptidase [bacterium]|nr:peptidase [bacterium]MCI0602585.1 peptidase [bacterium]
MKKLIWMVAFLILSVAAAKEPRQVIPELKERVKELPRTVIDYDRSLLNDKERKVVAGLIEASSYIDEIFWRQASEENPALRKELDTHPDSLAKQYFYTMKGRWDRVHHNEPFLGPFGKAGEKPQGGGFYPLDMTKEEFEKWIADHPEDKEKFQGLNNVIRRKEGKLVAVPYSVYYAEFLKPAAAKLREAAALTDNQSLKSFLTKRADAFLSDDYYESDFAWMDLDSNIEVVIGPYEVYEDGLFNYKAAFESFVTVVDKQESEKLKVYASHLPAMEKKLPMPDEHKNLTRGTDSPIKVVQEIFTAGDARRGVMTAAFNLPNDEKVREAKGSKKVLLKNVMQAKFQKTGEPIAKRVLDPSQVSLLSFDAYFNHTLFHELAHGLGPGIITGPDGKKIENRLLLKNLYSVIEECKADALGVWTLLYAIDQKLQTSFDKPTLYVTYAGLIFRLMRHGIEEAHGKANAIQWNWLREKGAIAEGTDGRFKVVIEKMPEGIQSLSSELLMIEATGDFPRAQKMTEKYGKSNPEIETINAQLKDLPVDISPIFSAAGEK